MKKKSSLLFTFFAFAYANILLAQSGGVLKPIQANMDIRHYTINLTVDIENKLINGFTEISLNLKNDADSILFDLIPAYKISSILADTKPTSFSHNKNAVSIVSKSKWTKGNHTIKINYSGQPPVAARPPWQGGFTWTKDKEGNPWVVINCQMEGGKIYFPCKDHPSDEPNEGADLFITVPNGLTVAGPGVLQSAKRNKKNNTATWHWKTNYTISNYCIVFDIGKYEVVKRNYTTIDGNTVPMEFYVLQQDKNQAEQVLDMRQRDTRILEKYFGEYPWIKEKIGIAEVPNYGMEHQTMITYGGENFNYKHYPGFDYSDNLFHEFTHEWFANKITNKDWAHFWIQEGITTYAEALFFRDMLGEKAYDSVMLSQRRSIQNKQPVVPGEGLNTLQVYNGDIYTKGSFLMHTIRYLMGDSLFFPALKALSTNVKYPYDTFLVSDDVMRHFSFYAHKDLKPIFYFYLHKTETLDIHVLKITSDSYAVYVENFPIELPFEIQTDTGTQRVYLKNFTEKRQGEILIIKSKTLPVIDPGDWYFKKVIYE